MIHRQLAKIRDSELRSVGRKMRRLPLWAWRLALTIAAVPVVMVCRLIQPWLCIRFGFLTVDRIGHFAFDLEYYLSERTIILRKEQSLDLFFYKRRPANSQLDLMARRTIFVHPVVAYLFAANRLLPGGQIHQIVPARHRTASRDKRGIFSHVSPQLRFTEDEEKSGLDYLLKVGCKDGAKVVCLVIRDQSYLKQIQGERDWSYHDFRDTKIEDYRDCALALAEKGYWVFRMGKVVSSGFGVEHSRIIDYARSPDRSDFLDVWLMSKCFFAISTGLGLDSIADIFRRPQVFVNYLPLMDLEAWGDYITVPKILSWAGSGRRLTLQEHLSHASVNGHYFRKSGIKITDLSPLHITDAVLEREARLVGTWSSSEEDVFLQETFWQVLRNDHQFDSYHGWIHPEACVGTRYLREAQTYLFA